jgi:2-oxo-4-hydroxy-4-carboxy-5-ureidoimidazoline decarboxylase
MNRLGIDQINAMTPGDFLAAFGGVFEHSPWIAERAWRSRPFSDASALHAAMVSVVSGASRAEQVALLNAHPELAGKEAQSRTLTPASTGEQASAGLNALSREEMTRIETLNRRHRDKFGFPFIIAVRLNSKERIFSEFERRLALDPDAELAACLGEVAAITRLRLAGLVDG